VTLWAAGPEVGSALAPSLVAAIALAAVHVLAQPLLDRAEALSGRTRRRLVSASAGASVAYVFIDVIPELAVQHRVVTETIGEAGLLFAEQRVYVLALVSFVLFYGLEHLVLADREHREATGTSHDETRFFPAHLLAFSAYTVLIGDLLVERAGRGPLPLMIYALAMAVHFVIVGHTLSERFRGPYARWGRWVLAASVIAGWALGATAQISEVTFARLFAVLAGGVVITSVQGELQGTRQGRLWPFVVGALVFAVALMSA
jgi:hypothetical protein